MGLMTEAEWAWSAASGMLVIWLGFLLGWGASRMRVVYLRMRFR